MPSVTLAQLQSYTLDRLEQNSALYPAGELTNAINEGYRITNLAVGLNQQTVSVPGFTVAGQQRYAIPSPILFPLKAYFEGRTLDVVSLEDLARDYPGWATDSTDKLGPVQRWATVGITWFVIHPIDNLGDRDLSVLGVVEPALLAAAGDVVDLDDEDVTMIVEYAAHRVQLKEGGRSFAAAATLLRTFYQKLSQRSILEEMDFPSYQVRKGAAR